MSSTVIRGLAWKRISPVEVDITRSRQHEFHAGGLQAILGRPAGKDTYPAKYHYWRPEHPKPVTAYSTFTFYDARENTPLRTELRLYYPTNTVTQLASAGDLFFIEFGSDGFSKVHIVQNGSPRCSFVAASLSQVDHSKANTLRIFSPQNPLAGTYLQEVLRLLSDAFQEDSFEQEIEGSAVVAASCEELTSTGERPSQSQIHAAVQTIQSVEWPGGSRDETVSKRMILERYLRQEIEVQRLASLSEQTSHTTQELRRAVQISSTQLRASEQHLKQAFVHHILAVLDESLGRLRMTVSETTPGGAVVLLQEEPRGGAETVVLVSMNEALLDCLATVQTNIDWVLTDTFPDRDKLQQLLSANPNVKISTVRSGPASSGPAPATWGPDLDAFLSV